MLEEKLVITYLNNWFDKYSTLKRPWSDNEVGRLLKKRLKELKKWKNSPRGNPKQAYQKSSKFQAKSIPKDDSNNW
jgi:hypothetical protein